MNKLTLVKIGKEDDPTPSVEDLETWKNIFNKAKDDPDFLLKLKPNKDICLEELEFDENDGCITLVKLGNKDYIPTIEDIECYRKLFQECSKDHNCIIFTRCPVEVKRFKIDHKNMVIVTSGDCFTI